jgi:hypothetical protein
MRMVQIRSSQKVPLKDRNIVGTSLNDNETGISKKGMENRQYVKDLYYIYPTLQLQIT